MSEKYTIIMVDNGYIFTDCNEDGDSPVVFESKDEDWGATIEELLWHIKSVVCEDSKYTRNRIEIIQEAGEKYELKDDEVLVETKHYKVRHKDEKLEYGEIIVKED